MLVTAADRAAFEAEMLPDTCTITRAATTAATYDPATMTATPAADTTVFTGACSISPDTNTDTNESGQPAVANQVTCRFPATATDLQPGDTVHVTAVGTNGDPDLVDRRFVIADIDRRTHLFLRRATATSDDPVVIPE